MKFFSIRTKAIHAFVLRLQILTEMQMQYTLFILPRIHTFIYETRILKI